MKKIKKGKYEYKGYIIFKNEYGMWLVDEPAFSERHGKYYHTVYGEKTLKDCKDWIDSELN